MFCLIRGYFSVLAKQDTISLWSETRFFWLELLSPIASVEFYTLEEFSMTGQQCSYKYGNSNQCSNKTLAPYDFCEQHVYELGIPDIFKMVSEHYRQDLREFWTRANMYVLSQAFLFSAFAVLASNFSNNKGHVHGHDFLIMIMVAIVGISIALCGLIVAWSSREWIARWKEATLQLDRIFNKHNTYTYTENEKKPLFDPTWWTMLLPGIFAFTWIILFAASIFSFFGWWM